MRLLNEFLIAHMFLLVSSVAAIILIVILTSMSVVMLNRRTDKKRRAKMHAAQKSTNETSGPVAWETQMAMLSAQHKNNVKRLKWNYRIGNYNQETYKNLNKIRYSISQISPDIISLVPSARWLFDNFQMMYREIKKMKTTETTYKRLPLLCKGDYKGYPRIYVVAKKMVDLSGGYLNEENILIMTMAYQKQVPLTEDELWALPEMIGLCILGEIIHVSDDIMNIIKVKSKADSFVKDRLLKPQDMDITPLLRPTQSSCRDNATFHSHVMYLLKNMSFEDEAIQRYIAYHCKACGVQKSPSDIIKEEGKIESVLESNIRTLIVSLREINQIDDEKLFEKLSLLESILLHDPDGIYSKMDAESKAVYRGIIVKLSHKYNKNEEDIGQVVLGLAIKGHEDLNCSHHVGTYLIGRGYSLLKAEIFGEFPYVTSDTKKNYRGFFYFIAIGLILSLAVYFMTYFLPSHYGINRNNSVILLFIGVPIFIGMALEITNTLLLRFISAKKLPIMDYLKEIPDSARTFIVMPVIIANQQQALDYIERLHRHYLSNRQNNLFFALLADFADASTRFLPSDEIIQEVLLKRIKELNERYPSTQQRFSLFIRSRNWNESEKCFMGWERKRGKLEEFNSLICGEQVENTTFSFLYCDREVLSTIRYVITLDADSTLILDHASKLVGLIDHPINRAVIDPVTKKIIEGYAIVQPSVRNHIVSKKSSLYPKIFSGESGISSYSTVVSDIYQDVFQAGIYVGKGIYNVSAFHQILHNAIPENAVLSHDLLESCYVKTAFSSVTHIMDNFPGSVLSYINREHRWIRGDWQLLPWLFHRTNIGVISKWKILDNLRRSIVPISKLLFIVLNLVLLPKAAYLWLLVVMFSDIFSISLFLSKIFIHKMRRPRLAIAHKKFKHEVFTSVLRAFVEIILLPYKAFISLDAIVRTLYRVLISKRDLLKWKTSESVEKSIENTKMGYFLHMWSSMIPGTILLLLLVATRAKMYSVILYTIVAILWIFSFFFAYLMSQPMMKHLHRLQPDHKELLLDTAVRIWEFFKRFSVKENHWLCPDNYQLANKEKVSDKTSPTNIGLQLLSVLSARDFGFETLTSTLNYVENIISVIESLPKWKGHLYNWYNIQTLAVLPPEYISTVDSGNFFGDIIALKNGLGDQKYLDILPDNVFEVLKKKFNQTNIELDITDQYATFGEFVREMEGIVEEIETRIQMFWEDKQKNAEVLEHIRLVCNEIRAFHLESSPFSTRVTLMQKVTEGNAYAMEVRMRIDSLRERIDLLLNEADFKALYNEKRKLFYIGYHVSSQTMDAGCYDLMASESLLTSFLAIARGEVPVKHWYKLGRPLTLVKGLPAFVSWSGTMFEYLMPHLIMKEYDGSDFAQTSKAAVLQQIQYGKNKEIPWGISESQYYRFDLDSNYQYRAFGVPGLRLQPSLRNSLVIAPYATMLAIDYAYEETMANLKQLMKLGSYGEYGFYEAIDFNGPDSINMKPYCIVKTYMAHHQGMSLVAINNFLHDEIMRKRFHKEPMIQAAEILLEEARQSYFISVSKKGYTVNIDDMELSVDEVESIRYVNSVAPQIPVVSYLSNNSYSILVTSDGDGFSNYKGLMLYRWRADVYANTGNYIYIKNVTDKKYWSTTYHPTKVEPDEYQVIFSAHKAEYIRKDGDIKTHTTISLTPNKSLEIRKVTLKNQSHEAKLIELTSYMEVVGDSYLAELSHPAFHKLFIESEFLQEHSIFLSRRRSNEQVNKNPYVLHMVKSSQKPAKSIEYEKDRRFFLGRNHTVENPEVVEESITLQNRAGFSSDPIMSLRVSILLEAEETATVSFITGICSDKEEAIRYSDKLSVQYRIDDITEKFKLQSEMELKYLNITSQQVNAFQNLISPLFYPSRFYRGPVENIRRNWKNQSFLWRFGVSGDNPIMLLRVSSLEEKGIIKDVLKAYEYLRMNQVNVDLIILNESKHGYMQELTNYLNDMISSLKIYDADKDKPSLFILHSYQMIPAELDLLYTVARIVFSHKSGIYFRNLKESIPEIRTQDY